MTNTSIQQVRAVALTVTATGAGAALAAFCRPDQVAASPGDPTSAVVTAAAWGAWACLGYLALAVAVAAAGHLPHLGRVVTAVQPLAPVALHRSVAAMVGATVAAGVVLAPLPAVAAAGAVPAAADNPRPPAPVLVTSSPLEWPGLTLSRARSTHHPTKPAQAIQSIQPVHATPPGERAEIVVRAGDSLWSLTARALGPDATPEQIATAWPRLYAANRSVIGPDPDLIQPGQRLVPPTAVERTPR